MKVYEKTLNRWKVEFNYSPFFEMMCSLHVLTKPEHHLGRLCWAKDLIERMDVKLYDKLIYLGTNFFEWCSSMDFDTLDNQVNDLNVITAIDYIAQMDIDAFIFILFGRELDKKRIDEFLIRKKTDNTVNLSRERSRVFEDPEGFRRDYISCIKEYYYLFFERELRFIEPLLIRIMKKQSERCENMGILEYIKTIHNRIEVTEDAFNFHKYTKFVVPFKRLENITIMVSSFIDPHLLIGIDKPDTVLLTVRANLQEISDEIPVDLFKTMKALGDETRLKIIKCIYKHKSSTQSLAKELGVTEACISKHLKGMHEAGLLLKERDGNYIYYFLDRMVLDRIPMDLYQYLDA